MDEEGRPVRQRKKRTHKTYSSAYAIAYVYLAAVIINMLLNLGNYKKLRTYLALI